MDILRGTVDKIVHREGAKKKFSVLTIGGKDMHAFDWHYLTAQGIKVGDQVAYAFEIDGTWTTIKALTIQKKAEEVALAGAPGKASGPFTVEAFVPTVEPKWQLGMPESMFISYAKDLLVGGVTADSAAAVKIMFDLMDAVRAEVATRQRPTPTT